MTREEIEKHIDNYVNDCIVLPEYILDYYDEVDGSLLRSNTAYNPNTARQLVDLIMIRESPLAKVMRELDIEN